MGWRETGMKIGLPVLSGILISAGLDLTGPRFAMFMVGLGALYIAIEAWNHEW